MASIAGMMSSATTRVQSLSAGSSAVSTSRTSRSPALMNKRFVQVRCNAEECNDEECAPTKEVGKLSMAWEAQEKTKVSGTFPPLARQERKWTGYVEKDTAGQNNIYPVEPMMYVADSAISSNTAGTSSEGADNNLAIAGFLSLIAIAGASSVLISVTKNAPTPPEVAVGYSGPTLSYYIAKFTPEAPAAIVEAVQAAPAVVEETATLAAESIEAAAPEEASA